MDYLQCFCDELRDADAHSQRTIHAYRLDLLQFQNYLKRQRQKDNLISIATEDLTAYVEYMVGHKIAATTISRKLEAIGAFFDKAKELGWTQYDPLLRFSMPEYCRAESRPISDEEVLALLKKITGCDELSLRDRVIICLLSELGLRVSELASIRYTDLDSASQRLHITNGYKRSLAVTDATWATIQQLIAKQAKHEGVLIRNKHRTGLNVRSVRRILKKYADLAQLDWQPNPANFRHAIAIRMIKEQWSLQKIARFLGHKDTGSLRLMYHEVWIQNRDES